MNEKDALGYKTGYWIEKSNDGNPVCEGNYIDGTMVGQWKFYHYRKKQFIKSKNKFKEGPLRLSNIGFFKQAIQVDLWKEFDRFGQLKNEIIHIK